jgi:hypothetical protein
MASFGKVDEPGSICVDPKLNADSCALEIRTTALSADDLLKRKQLRKQQQQQQSKEQQVRQQQQQGKRKRVRKSVASDHADKKAVVESIILQLLAGQSLENVLTPESEADLRFSYILQAAGKRFMNKAVWFTVTHTKNGVLQFVSKGAFNQLPRRAAFGNCGRARAQGLAAGRQTPSLYRRPRLQRHQATNHESVCGGGGKGRRIHYAQTCSSSSRRVSS